MKSDSEYSNQLKDAEMCPHGNFKINPCEACESETVKEKEADKENELAEGSKIEDELTSPMSAEFEIGDSTITIEYQNDWKTGKIAKINELRAVIDHNGHNPLMTEDGAYITDETIEDFYHKMFEALGLYHGIADHYGPDGNGDIIFELKPEAYNDPSLLEKIKKIFPVYEMEDDYLETFNRYNGSRMNFGDLKSGFSRLEKNQERERALNDLKDKNK